MNTVTIDGMTRGACALAMTLCSLHELIVAGFIEGPEPMTPEGLAACERLKAAGFEFNPGEMEKYAGFVLDGGLQRSVA